VALAATSYGSRSDGSRPPRLTGLRRAFITGIGGQDGTLLATLLFEQGYEVFGTIRRARASHGEGLERLADRVTIVEADLLDRAQLEQVIGEVRPAEIYNLASPSFVPRSWEQPVLTAEFAAVGATSLLEAVRLVDPTIRVYQASSSEIFGIPAETPQTETTPLRPLTPYGVAKAYAHFIAGSYRHQYGMFTACGILYNHESPLRPAEFLPRKVSRAVAAIARGREKELVLGDLAARRDWGYAGDYVRAMWLMLQADEPGDYVVATGEAHSVEELVAQAFAVVDLDWRAYVRVDPTLVRGRAELHDLVGDAARARLVLGWEPEIDFSTLVRMLVEADLERLDG
jgi:GDPmannose 4,6-dehydratase